MMAFLNKAQSLVKRFKRDESGTFALTWSLSLTVMLGAMGAAVDYAMLSNADSQSQSIADTTALAAAIYVKNHGMPPESSTDGYVNGVPYTAADLGYEYKGWVKDGDAGVSIQVDYDDNVKEAVVTVSGDTTPFLMQILGYEQLAFKAISTVSYLDVDEKFPASIALVLDNSGSMAWDDKFANNNGTSPANAQPRIDGLEDSVEQFMANLESRLGAQVSTGRRVLRTGMLPYNHQLISSGTVDMQWGRISSGSITAMNASGSTNSSPPMAEAWEWLQDEDQPHYDEADRMGEAQEDPLKFVIFMTDGQNTSGNYTFVADDTTNRFYAFKSLFGYSARWWVSTGGPYDSDFEEGYLFLASDQETLEACQEMNNAGVKVFSIGYALQPGHYNSNDSSDPSATREVTVGMQVTAHGLLAGCATDASTMFIEADDVEQLEAAFDEIQNAIVEELIRIKS